MEPGTVESSAITFVTISVAVVFTSYYIFFATGLFIGTILVLLSIALVVIISQSLVRCATHFKTDLLEDIALKAYGDGLSKFTSLMQILTQMGFMVANVVLVKTMLPYGLEQGMLRSLPYWLSTS